MARATRNEQRAQTIYRRQVRKAKYATPTHIADIRRAA